MEIVCEKSTLLESGQYYDFVMRNSKEFIEYWMFNIKMLKNSLYDAVTGSWLNPVH
jgi:hypothetical protein